MRHIKYKQITYLFILLCHLGITGYGQTKSPKQPEENIDFVNSLIGTATTGFGKGLDGGGTMPCVNVPFAMTNFVAQTDENKMGRMNYEYEDKTVIGFLASHQPTVWMGDYGYVSVMPQIGELKVLPEERALAYEHTDEIAKPYYYSVKLKTAGGGKIKAEIAGANTCGMFRFTFPAAEQAQLIIQGINLPPGLTDWANDYTARIKNLKGYVNIDTVNNEITGYNPDRQSAQLGPSLKNFRGYFIIRFNKPIKNYGTWDNHVINKGNKSQYGTRMGAYISFKTTANDEVKVMVATSFISLEQARANLKKEISNWDFEKLVKSTRDEWQNQLKVIKLNGVSADNKTIFYTALYHTLLFPRQFSENGRYYSAFDDNIHKGISYNDYSLWDTFRALHPLLLLTQPKRAGDMIQSLLQMYKEGGWMPMWPNPTYTNIMIGTHADAVIADAYVKGYRGFDVKLAYQAIHKDAFTPPDGDTLKQWGDRDIWTSFEGRGGLTYYHNLGYVPADKTKESVSRTIEYSIDDYCVAQVAKGIGKTDDYKKIMSWSKNYKNVYNQSTGFMAPRRYDGAWSSDPEAGFTEGTKWTYTFGAMHDVKGMIELMGGQKQFAEKLSLNFDGGHYRADNEPGHHYLYLFNYCGMPGKTQELVREHTSSENFRNLPVGINGNDDCGQTSAWYIFNTMGFYPLSPATGIYSIGAPQFPTMTLDLGYGKNLTIKAVHLSTKNKYVKKVVFNGKIIKDHQLIHKELIKGGALTFYMTDVPTNL
ncbi:GH92 family glycosyl hydrolase [Mucilaginibacter sp. BJC16-A38]|uniref:GH92 family glycosyl hydrolase n=1 Tax=Mucilaginibacter phenanthrenivorans TaxID=1234842 RepID=UPI00215713C2|nr:GH92 family glycosyl hydrolase [Mucilaginibacter phenanthrenivorans]MCR8557207.1 GH92 family glycosyl hydrolase [Mucilaginibacter phenanthrenivorans]